MLDSAYKAGKGIMIGSQASSSLGTYHSAILATDNRVTHPSELSFPLKLKTNILQNFNYKNGVLAVNSLEKLELKRLENNFKT